MRRKAVNAVPHHEQGIRASAHQSINPTNFITRTHGVARCFTIASRQSTWEDYRTRSCMSQPLHLVRITMVCNAFCACLSIHFMQLCQSALHPGGHSLLRPGGLLLTGSHTARAVQQTRLVNSYHSLFSLICPIIPVSNPSSHLSYLTKRYQFDQFKPLDSMYPLNWKQWKPFQKNALNALHIRTLCRFNLLATFPVFSCPISPIFINFHQFPQFPHILIYPILVDLHCLGTADWC